MAQVTTHEQDCILIIERDAHTAHLLDFMLSREGYKVVSSSSCESACLLMRKMLAPCVVFLDLELSRENNFSLLHRIRGMPGWQTTPIILLAENHVYQDVNPALDAGATDYIMQPFNPSELMIHVQRHKYGLTN